MSSHAHRGEWSSGGLTLRWVLGEATPEGLRDPGLITSDADLVLLVRVGNAAQRSASVELAVELRRGDRVRDRWTRRMEVLAGHEEVVAFTPTWSGSRGSSRLECVLALNGQEVARPGLLLGRPEVDAQGRFASGTTADVPSPATLLVFERELRERISPEN